MQAIQPDNISTDTITLPEWEGKGIAVDILRLDKIHPVVSGNKWFKLRFYLDDAIYLHKKHIITFGGPWSNHIIATAATCNMKGLKCTGIIRGEKPNALSATLIEAENYGMKLCFITRNDYAKKLIPTEIIQPDSYVIPEGGYGDKGAAGAATILDCCNKKIYTHICCAAGTGTMAAGLLQAENENQQLIVFSVLKNNFELEDSITSLLTASRKMELVHGYHFGGYAKYTPALFNFMNHFYKYTGVPLDFVYTAKMMAGVNDFIQNQQFGQGSRILVIHSGGLQGNTSLPKGTLIF